jgi:DNA polymerase V
MDSLAAFQNEKLPLTVAEGFLDTDLNSRLIFNRTATHLFAADSNAIQSIFRGDILIVDRAIKPSHGNIILAEINGEYKIRRLIKQNKRWLLVTDREEDVPFWANETNGFYCGTVTHSITKHFA